MSNAAYTRAFDCHDIELDDLIATVGERLSLPRLDPGRHADRVLRASILASPTKPAAPRGATIGGKASPVKTAAPPFPTVQSRLVQVSPISTRYEVRERKRFSDYLKDDYTTLLAETRRNHKFRPGNTSGQIFAGAGKTGLGRPSLSDMTGYHCQWYLEGPIVAAEQAGIMPYRWMSAL